MSRLPAKDDIPVVLALQLLLDRSSIHYSEDKHLLARNCYIFCEAQLWLKTITFYRSTPDQNEIRRFFDLWKSVLASPANLYHGSPTEHVETTTATTGTTESWYILQYETVGTCWEHKRSLLRKRNPQISNSDYPDSLGSSAICWYKSTSVNNSAVKLEWAAPTKLQVVKTLWRNTRRQQTSSEVWSWGQLGKLKLPHKQSLPQTKILLNT